MASRVMGFAARQDGGGRFIRTRQEFRPKKVEYVKCGDRVAGVYPVLEPTASDAEKSHAFWVTAKAMEISGVGPKQRLDFLAERMGLATEHLAQVAQMMDDWRKGWQNPRHFRFINFRDEGGAAIANCFTNTGELRPIQNGPAASCRPAGIKFITVMTELTVSGTKRMSFS